MQIGQVIFLIFLIILSDVSAFKTPSFLTKTLEKKSEKSGEFITINLKKTQITSKQKHEIFDFVSKSQSYLSSQEKNIMFASDHKLSTSSSAGSSIQKISLYNYKNTQVI